MSSTAPRDLGDEDPGPLADVDAAPDETVDEQVIDISDNSGPELTANVDDIDPGAGGV